MNPYADRSGHWTDAGQARGVVRSRTRAEVTFPRLPLWAHVIGYGSQLDSFGAVLSPAARSAARSAPSKTSPAQSTALSSILESATTFASASRETGRPSPRNSAANSTC
jgi:hypothetical protein